MEVHNNRRRHHHDESGSVADKPRIIVVAGPTAVGKTSLGIELAQAFDGEVVNADSRYLYRGFDIGVAKPGPEEQNGVPHHLIDVLPPDGTMSLARYQDLAMSAIGGIVGRGKLPLLVGGTPLYINAVVEGWRIPRVPPHAPLRASLDAEAANLGIGHLIARLRSVDPISAARCGTNLRRIIRALEVFSVTGIPMSSQEGKGPPPFHALEIGLMRSREALYRAIDARVTDQIDQGLVAEVQRLRESGIRDDAPAMTSIGYRQLLPYLRGEQSLDEAVAQIRHDTHRYVRHQETWLRRNPRLVWIDTESPSWRDAARDHVRAFLDIPGDRTR